ncbi:MAG: RNA polymerase sigma factor [Gammaproteobacteria bacterium]
MSNQSLPTDDELIPKLLDNDETAYKQVVRAYHGIMVHVARSIVGDAIADEVAQEAWVAVLRALPKFERRSSLKTWILRITSNCAKSRLRHESRTVNFDDIANDGTPMISDKHFDSTGHWASPPSVWHADTPDSLLSGSQLQDHIDKALKELPAPQKAVITLRDIQGLDMETICKILEVSESNGRVLLHRARSRIREVIDTYFENEGSGNEDFGNEGFDQQGSGNKP